MSKAPVYPKRLIEVDLPIRALSAIKGRQPSAGDVNARDAGLWWSRKPQNQCRAIILAALLPDPGEEDPKTARVLAGVLDVLESIGLASRDECRGDASGKRAVLTRFCQLVADPGAWGDRVSAALPRILALVDASTQTCLDPFAGGGSIPVEARRLGLNSIAGEYNPVVLDQLRASLEWAGAGAGQNIPKVEQLLRDAIVKAQRTAARGYPPSRAQGHPLGFVVFRALVCEGPQCGRVVPATSKFVLDAGTNTRVVIADTKKPGQRVTLRLVVGGDDATPAPSMGQGKLQCPVCHFTMKRADVVRQLANRRCPDFPVAAVFIKDGHRDIRPIPKDIADAIEKWDGEVELKSLKQSMPTDEWPPTEPRRFSPPLYGFTRFADCHTERQLLWLGSLLRELREHAPVDTDVEVATLYYGLGRLLVARLVERHTSFCRWRSDKGGYEWTFAGKSLGMIWDFFEANPLHPDNDAQVVLSELAGHIRRCSERLKGAGAVLPGPAQQLALPDDAVDLLYTDPPYFDAIPYSHLSDWAFVWARSLNRAGTGLKGLAPKEAEIAVDRPHSRSPSTHDSAYFTRELGRALAESRRVLKPDGLGIVVFAHSSTTAWESLISALLEAGFIVTASWPVETERSGRLQAQGTASLESSIHIVCRPRENADGSLMTNHVGDWREVLAALPKRISAWMPRLAKEGIVGADAIFACIGPALEIYSQYTSVEKPSGERVPLIDIVDESGRLLKRGYLSFVWEAVAQQALQMIFAGADAAGFEADARLTAMWLWTLSTATNATAEPNAADLADDESEPDEGTKRSKGGFVLEYDAARKIAQGLGAHLEDLSSLVEVNGEKARLIPVAERTQSLFAKGAAAGGSVTAKKKRKQQQAFGFVDELEQAEQAAGWGDIGAPERADTALDRVHQAMILFGAGRGEALKRFLVEDGVGRDSRFWKLAQALSQLYSPGTDERRWVEGVLARKKGLGF